MIKVNYKSYVDINKHTGYDQWWNDDKKLMVKGYVKGSCNYIRYQECYFNSNKGIKYRL